MRSLTITAFIIALCSVASPSNGAEREGEAIVFKVSAQPAMVRHLKLLEIPSYLALALDNNGFSPSKSSRLVIKSRTEFEISAASLRFLNRKGAVYSYEASIKLPMVGAAALRMPVEVDISAIEAGSLILRIYPPLSSLLPSDLLERIEFKVRALANEQTQTQVIHYLDEIARRPPLAGSADPMLEAILVEAYNRGTPTVTSSSEIGDAAPLVERYALITTLAVWLMLMSLLALRWVWQRKRRKT